MNEHEEQLASEQEDAAIKAMETFPMEDE